MLCYSTSTLRIIFLIMAMVIQTVSLAESTKKGTRLVYLEREDGIEPYYVTYTVTSEFIRIDDTSDTSGYIIFNVLENRIYSISHYDQSILIIPEYKSNKSNAYI